MKIKIDIENRLENNEVILFGARHNYLRANWGNNSRITFNSLEFDENYLNAIGILNIENQPEDGLMSCFHNDCIKHDLRVVSINGEPLKKIILGTEPIEYETIKELNPYTDEYKIKLNIGITSIEIELIKK